MTLITQNSLAYAYADDCRLTQAIELLERVAEAAVRFERLTAEQRVALAGILEALRD